MVKSPGVSRRGVLGLSLLSACAAAWPARAGQLYLSGSQVGGGAARLKVESFQERKFRTTIAQQYDYSCGSAALATLLTYTYGQPTSEKTVFDSMFENGNKEIIGTEGFSLLDMKRYMARRDIRAEGFKAPLAKLIEVRVPAIVLINVRGYNHFVVLEGVQDGRVLMSDPAVGVRTASVSDFQAQWNGIFFLILADVETAQSRFNSSEKWATVPKAPNTLTRYVLDFAMLSQPVFRDGGRF